MHLSSPHRSTPDTSNAIGHLLPARTRARTVLAPGPRNPRCRVSVPSCLAPRLARSTLNAPDAAPIHCVPVCLRLAGASPSILKKYSLDALPFDKFSKNPQKPNVYARSRNDARVLQFCWCAFSLNSQHRIARSLSHNLPLSIEIGAGFYGEPEIFWFT